jgi:hypothetical protein
VTPHALQKRVARVAARDADDESQVALNHRLARGKIAE